MLADESARRYKRPLPIRFWSKFASSCASLLPASSSYGSVSSSIPVVAGQETGKETDENKGLAFVVVLKLLRLHVGGATGKRDLKSIDLFVPRRSPRTSRVASGRKSRHTNDFPIASCGGSSIIHYTNGRYCCGFHTVGLGQLSGSHDRDDTSQHSLEAPWSQEHAISVPCENNQYVLDISTLKHSLYMN